nr:FHA domain-containing protein [Myxococcus sp. MH1]
MSQIAVHIEDTRTGQVETRHVDNLEARCSRETGIVIGSATDCDIVLASPEVCAHHARWYPGGYHRFVLLLDEDAVINNSRGDPYRGGETLRVDHRPFQIGPFIISI